MICSMSLRSTYEYSNDVCSSPKLTWLTHADFGTLPTGIAIVVASNPY